MKMSRVPFLIPSLHCQMTRAAILAGGLLLTLTIGCGFSVESDLCSQFEGAPLKEPVGEPPLLVLLDPAQRFAVYHGSACAQSKEDGEEKIIKVQQALELPAFANRATVFLNGWKLKYLSKDHEIQGVGTIIGKIELARNTLTWQAAGILADKNFDDAYEWCYHYTIIAWSDPAIDATVDHGDVDKFCDPSSAASNNFYYADNDGTTTALAAHSSFIQNLASMSPGTVAVLPRGFGFKGDEQHHLLQVAYNLDHSETFVEQGKQYKKGFQKLTIPSTTLASHADSGFVSWDSYVVFKDNDKRRGYGFGEMTSALGGADVGVIQPPYSILPKEDTGPTTTCVSSGQPDILTQEFTVENIPFECAIPMLTGWELKYGCDDEHVTEMGVWIDEWSYQLGPQGGTLRYKVSSVLRDKDSQPEHIRSQKVAILGLGHLMGGQGVKGAGAASGESSNEAQQGSAYEVDRAGDTHTDGGR
jgi:hypothetical protein